MQSQRLVVVYQTSRIRHRLSDTPVCGPQEDELKGPDYFRIADQPGLFWGGDPKFVVGVGILTGCLAMHG